MNQIFSVRSISLSLWLLICLMCGALLDSKIIKAQNTADSDSPKESIHYRETVHSSTERNLASQLFDPAPEYCSSTGGSTSYENISNITITPNADGTMQMKVDVFIANPEGCTAGTPCPSYDNSPEYVNAWIDWNGDKVWDSSERVLDKALTGYLTINYGGTMSTIAQITPPATFTETTWLRANLGWSFDPNDACTSTWEWGNVVDQQLTLSAPKIKEIKISGSKDPKHPMTTYDVNAEVILEDDAAYDITKVSWSGDLKPGDGNPYKYKPDAGKHGKKKIKVTVSYKHKTNGATGQISKDHEFKLFFEKKGDDDGDGDVNWFEYWGKDGAVPGLTESSVVYDASGTGYGAWSWTTDKLTLKPKAAEEHYPSKLEVPAITNCPGGSFGGAKGIDSVMEVIVHEREHEKLWENWNTNSVWTSTSDTDSDDPTPDNKKDFPTDWLPDAYETSTTGTDPNKIDSCDLQTIKSSVYSNYGDNEFVAVQAGHGKTGVADKDWANPGKQTTPKFVALVTAASSNLPTKVSAPAYGLAPYNSYATKIPGLAELTGIYTSTVVDLDGDSVNESLRVSTEINVLTSDIYDIVGWLQSDSGVDIGWARYYGALAVGTELIELDFDGEIIQQKQADGPYTLKRIEIRIDDDHGDVIDFAEDVHTTEFYSASSFTPLDVSFIGNYSDSGQDEDDNGIFEQLSIAVDLQVNSPSNYTIVGWLYDSNGNPISGANATTSFSESGTYSLDFDSQSIRWHRENGPYVLRHLEIRDENENRVNFITNAYTTTTAYDVDLFEGSELGQLDKDSFTDEGLDFDEDGLFDFLRVNYTATVNLVDNYILLAELRDSAGETIASIEKQIFMTMGENSVALDFPGGQIRGFGEDGPYEIALVSLQDSSGGVIDLIVSTGETQAYDHTLFAIPLISLTGSYSEAVEDLNGDEINDFLMIGIEVVPGNDGVVIAQGRLVDTNGNEIELVENNVAVTAGAPQTVTLPFSATQILSGSIDGPYQLVNLLVYHTADPNQAISVLDAYVTAPYDYTTLVPKVVIGPPASVQVATSPELLTADGESASTITVVVTDEDGNFVPNETIVVSATLGTLNSNSLTTNISGTASVNLVSSTQSGLETITISVGTLTQDVPIEFVAGPPTSLSLAISPTTIIADGESAALITTNVIDAFSNPVANQEITFSSSTGVISDTAITDINGNASELLTASTIAGSGIVTATPTMVIADGESTALVMVSVEDAFGNSVPDQEVDFATLMGTVDSTALTDADGDATASVTAPDIVGSGIITVSVNDLVDITTLEFVAGPPTLLTTIVSPTTIVADGVSTSNVIVQVEDAFGHPIVGAEVSFNSTSGTIPATAITNEDGRATTVITAPVTGGIGEIITTIGELTANATIDFMEKVLPSILITSTIESIPADATSTTEISVTLVDGLGNPLPNREVQFTTTNGTIESPVLTDQDGVATTTLTSSVDTGIVTVVGTFGEVSEEINVQFNLVEGTNTETRLFLPLFD